MTNTYGSILMAILLSSSACLANAQSQPSVAIIIGEVREPTAREITFSYQPPSAIGSGEGARRARQPEPLCLRVARRPGCPR